MNHQLSSNSNMQNAVSSLSMRSFTLKRDHFSIAVLNESCGEFLVTWIFQSCYCNGIVVKPESIKLALIKFLHYLGNYGSRSKVE